MTSKAGIAQGMATIAEAYGAPPPSPIIANIWARVCGHLSDEAFTAAVWRMLAHEPSVYGKFPPPALLMKHAHARVSEAETHAEAARAFDLARALTVHSQCGKAPCSCVEERWDSELIEQKLGRGARFAFLAAGGESAFRSARISDEPFLQRRFIEAYAEVTRATPALALPPGLDTPKALPPGPEEEHRDMSRDDAKLTVEEIRKRLAGLQPPPPAEVTLTDERAALLRAQRQQLAVGGTR